MEGKSPLYPFRYTTGDDNLDNSMKMQIFSSKEEGSEGSSNKSKGDQAKELLTKYGGAYLATSITLSLISFGLCYALINAGVDVPSLLQKVRLTSAFLRLRIGR